MLKVGIVGISGYSGAEALEILLKHPGVRVTYAAANNTTGKVADIWPHLKGLTKLTCEVFNLKKAQDCDYIFLAVPHTTSMDITPQLLQKGVRVIDLSGDYRLSKAGIYKQWYGKQHSDQKNLKKAVYGLPELFREDIKKANLLANPGCYPTAALLGLAPIMSTQPGKISAVTIDAKSGTSGAGRKANLNLSFCEVNENFKAYKVLKHQHNPEIDQYLSRLTNKEEHVHFVAHLLPVNRGILETIYVHLNKPVKAADIQKIYDRFYKTEKFVRVLAPGRQPELKNVVKTNFCDLGITVDKTGRLVVITSAIDNLVKGAAGQAVQNMNIMCGFDETTAL